MIVFGENKKFIILVGLIALTIFSVASASDEWGQSSCMIGGASEDLQCCTSAGLDGGKDRPYSDSDAVNSMGCVWNLVTNVLSEDISKSNDIKMAAVKKYCNTMFSSSTLQGRIYYSSPLSGSNAGLQYPSRWDWQKTFDSHQSIFTYALCSSFLQGEEMPFIPKSYNKYKTSIAGTLTGNIVKTLKLQQRSKGKNLCSLEDGGLSDCDMSIYATEVFSAVMSDIFKIAYAQTLNVNTVEDFETNQETKIADFFKGRLKQQGSGTGFSELKSKFTQTVSIVDNNQKIYKKTLDSIKIINNSELAKLASGCSLTGDIVGNDFIACALHKSQGKGTPLTPAFLTLFYNELLNYRVFLLYYEYELNSQLALNEDLSSDKKNLLQLEIDALQSRSNIQLEAAENTLKDFEEFNMTYPLHIGLLMYQEQLQSFRKDLSPLVTVFYSLSEKLQNVQDANS